MSERRRRDQRTDQIIIEIAKGGPVLAALRIQELKAENAELVKQYEAAIELVVCSMERANDAEAKLAQAELCIPAEHKYWQALEKDDE